MKLALASVIVLDQPLRPNVQVQIAYSPVRCLVSVRLVRVTVAHTKLPLFSISTMDEVNALRHGMQGALRGQTQHMDAMDVALKY